MCAPRGRDKLGSLVFRDPEAALRAKDRLEAISHTDLSPLFERGFLATADPQLALNNLERWLLSTANPSTYLELLLADEGRAGMLLTLLGSSQPIANSLIQNPELASLVVEEGVRQPTLTGLMDEGRRLLSSAESHSHRLDRLRYLKQRWIVPITLSDLTGRWTPEVVWAALSDLAEALVALAAEVCWSEFATDRPCPVSIVAFGKLGGRELNYSSDIDLVYLMQDDADSKAEAEAIRWANTLGRAISDSMGRGSLYRVDLRLRPFGAAGPLTPTMRAVEAYYRSHAEQWEVQALIRTRVLYDPAGVAERWAALVEGRCFSHALDAVSLQSLLDNRARVEEHAPVMDLKRGLGGIRDVEFATQILQLVHGRDWPQVRVANTVEALRELGKAGAISQTHLAVLEEGYRFLRQLEHRCQLVGDQQTHELPADEAALRHVALLAGHSGASELVAELNRIRTDIRSVYGALFTLGSSQRPRQRALEAAGLWAGPLATWFDALPESESFYSVLADNEGSLQRVVSLLAGAPRAVERLRRSVPLTEGVLSGEIEEPDGFASRTARLPADAPEQALAAAYEGDWLAYAVRYALDDAPHYLASLTSLTDGLLAHLVKASGQRLSLIALGSYGTGEFGPGSDADILFLAEQAEHEVAERAAQGVLAVVERMRRYGSPLQVDLRLRPEGRKGLLVRTLGAFQTYELEAMELWERFALGHARLVCGSEAALDVVKHAAYALPVTPERLRELLAMKHRIETERVPPQHVRRDVKLGYGGLNDLEWFVHLHEMRFPTATRAGASVGFADRCHRLLESRLINAVEHEELLDAHRHLLRVRVRLWLLENDDDVIPENPAKLDRLAAALGYLGGHEFLKEHERVIEGVRSIYQDGLDRLNA